jgi:prophage antirepressor-like protein
MNEPVHILTRLINYDDNNVYIAFDDVNYEPYFQVIQLCAMLGYADPHNALKRFMLKKYIVELKDIVKDYKSLYKNIQGHTKFINEEGLYRLIIFCRNKKKK